MTNTLMILSFFLCIAGCLISIGYQILYELDHRKPVHYVIPIENIQEKLPVQFCQLVTKEPFSTTCVACFQVRLATAGRMLAMDAGCGFVHAR
jgi:hypothetical protein